MPDVDSDCESRWPPWLETTLKDGDFVIFLPVKTVKPGKRVLTKEQNKFVKTYFKKYIADGVIQASILEDSPVPEPRVLVEHKLDPEISATIPSGKACSEAWWQFDEQADWTNCCVCRTDVPNCGFSMPFKRSLAFHQEPQKCKDILVGNDVLLRSVGWTGHFSLRSGS